MPNNFDQFSTVKLLLPNYFRLPGIITLLLGTCLSYLRFGLGINPKIFECKVFAVYSAYFKTHYFSIIENNVMEELCGVLILLGLFLIALAKEKDEKPIYQEFRAKALLLSIIGSTVIVLFSFIFVFGTAFLAMLTINIFLPLILYNLSFFFILYRYKYQNKVF